MTVEFFKPAGSPQPDHFRLRAFNSIPRLRSWPINRLSDNNETVLNITKLKITDDTDGICELDYWCSLHQLVLPYP